MTKVLVVVAHPDDEVLGAGGTIAKHTQLGDEVYCLILGEGISSRYPNKRSKLEQIKLETEQGLLRTKVYLVANILSLKGLFLKDFPDQQFDTIPILNIIKTIEEVKDEVKPNIIYTHYEHDLNLDHRITFQATLTACRPLPGEITKRIYSFEVPSSTEWGFKQFEPSTFVDISDIFSKKIEALKCYESEIREYPHPRSPEAIEALAKYRGSQSGLKMAEAFKLIRWVK